MTPPVLHTLEEAAAILSPSGAVTARSLRTEIENGNLRAVKIARKHFVTDDALKDMVMQCQDQRSRPVSGSDDKEDAPPSGSSRTDRLNAAQARLKANTKKLKKPSRNISGKSTSTPATVLPMRR